MNGAELYDWKFRCMASEWLMYWVVDNYNDKGEVRRTNRVDSEA